MHALRNTVVVVEVLSSAVRSCLLSRPVYMSIFNTIEFHTLSTLIQEEGRRDIYIYRHSKGKGSSRASPWEGGGKRQTQRAQDSPEM